MRVWQPGVEGEKRHFNGKGNEDSPKGHRRQRGIRRKRHHSGNSGDVPGSRLQVDGNESQEHRHRTDQRVEEELDGRVLRSVFLLSPNSN